MPSTIIGSSTWNTRGIVLSSQSAQEQVNGLVNVQVEYTVPASKQAKIDQLFYVDAPPPIWPSVVNRGEMLTNNIYMTERTVERANGLVRVQASYVGGLQRQGFRGYFLREVRETRKKAVGYTYVNSRELFSRPGFTILSAVITNPFGGFANVGYGLNFVFDELIKLVEFPRIGGKSFVNLPVFTRGDIASIAGSQQFNWPAYARVPQAAMSADVWTVEGSPEEARAGLLSFEKNTPIPYTQTSNYITPNVEVVTLEYRLTR